MPSKRPDTNSGVPHGDRRTVRADVTGPSRRRRLDPATWWQAAPARAHRRRPGRFRRVTARGRRPRGSSRRTSRTGCGATATRGGCRTRRPERGCASARRGPSGTPRRTRRVGIRAGDDVLDGAELQRAIRTRPVNKAFRAQLVDHHVVDQRLVEVVVAHRPRRRVRGFEMQPVMIRLAGAVDVAQLIAGGLRGVDVVKGRGGGPNGGELVGAAGRRHRARADERRDRR